MKFNPTYTPSLFLFAIFVFLILSFYNDLEASELYFIDAHSQVDQNVKNLEQIIRRMDDAGVYVTILAARGGRKSEEIVSFAKTYSNRIVPAVRTKSGAYNQNNPKYYKKLHKQIDSGDFNAMAEVLMYHAQKGDKAPEVIVFPNDQRVRAALNAAIEKSWPFVIHIEFGSLRGAKREKFMTEMEDLLRAHPHHAFALNHVGQLDAGETHRLIKNFKNIYFLTAHTTPVISQNSNQPWVNMFRGETIAKKWEHLLLRYPNRFIFALDNVWGTHWNEFYHEQMRGWSKALADLPPDVAHAIAHGNAERLWKIPPKPDNYTWPLGAPDISSKQVDLARTSKAAYFQRWAP